MRRRIFKSLGSDGQKVILAPIIGKDGKVHRFVVLDYRDPIPVRDGDRDVAAFPSRDPHRSRACSGEAGATLAGVPGLFVGCAAPHHAVCIALNAHVLSHTKFCDSVSAGTVRRTLELLNLSCGNRCFVS